MQGHPNRPLVRTFAVGCAAVVAACIALFAVLAYVGLREPAPPVDAIHSRVQLAAMLPPAPRGSRLVRTEVRSTHGCRPLCGSVARTYALPDRLLTVGVVCGTIFDALDALENAGEKPVDEDHVPDRDACPHMIVPSVTLLMQREDDSRRRRFVFEAYPTKRDDAIVFAALEPPR